MQLPWRFARNEPVRDDSGAQSAIWQTIVEPRNKEFS